jgi:hypothetical protein
MGITFFIQKTAPPIVSVVFVLTGIALGIGGLTFFAGEGDAHADAPGPHDAHVSLVKDLCAAQQAAVDDPTEATTIFQDEVHVPLHDLAADVQEADRDAAAGLLEAKQAVEARVGTDRVPGEGLESDLAELLEASVVGLRAIDVEAPTC